MKGEDQFHVGIVVPDVDTALAELTELLGYDWCDQLAIPTAVWLPTGETTIEMRFAYSRTVPRLEVISAVLGTLWEPAASGLHHLGYWSDDVAGDGARLAERGYETEAEGRRPDGATYWSYHRPPAGPRIELVSREVQAGLEGYWSS